MADKKYQKDIEELNKVDGLYRLSKLLGASGGVLILLGCLLLVFLCSLIGKG